MMMVDVNNTSAAAGGPSKVPPLTQEEVVKAVKEAKNWRHLSLCFGTLYLVSSIEETVEQFLLGRGFYQPSWRAVIFALNEAGETQIANRIRSYREPIQDPTLTPKNVTPVMEVVITTSSRGLASNMVYGDTDMIVPYKQLTEFRRRCSTVREVAIECATCYVNFHPQSSWTHLATSLYRRGEFAVMEKLKPFLPLRDLTITVEKLLELLEVVGDDEDIGDWLDAPRSKVAEIEANYDSHLRRREAYLDAYANHHPCPSWKQVAVSFRSIGLFHQADEVESTYVQACDIAQIGEGAYVQISYIKPPLAQIQ